MQRRKKCGISASFSRCSQVGNLLDLRNKQTTVVEPCRSESKLQNSTYLNAVEQIIADKTAILWKMHGQHDVLVPYLVARAIGSPQ